MKKYLCRRECFFQRLYRKGEVELFADDVNVPEHFDLIEDIPTVIISNSQGSEDAENGGSDESNDELPTGGGNVDEEELYLLLEDKSIAELKKYAANEAIELGTATKNADIIKLIVASKVYGAELTDEVPEDKTPDPGKEQKTADKEE